MSAGVEHVAIGLTPVAAFAHTHTYCMPSVRQSIEVVDAERNGVRARRESDSRAFVQSGVSIDVILRSGDVCHGMLLGVEHVAVGL